MGMEAHHATLWEALADEIGDAPALVQGEHELLAAHDGEFLRTRREQLQPADVGLPHTGRRRTPGLRREEVAALADALRLDRDERVHLKKLARCASTPELCPLGDGPVDEIADSVRALLDRLDPTPAVLVGPWYQVLAHNEAWTSVMREVGVLDQPQPNLARFTFLDPRARDVYPGWEEAADEQAAVLRDAQIRWHAEPGIAELLEELLGVPEFAERWRVHDVARKRRGTKTIRHPGAGALRIDYEVLFLPDDADQRIITWLPADPATEAALERLVQGEPRAPAALRVVGD